MRIAIPLANDLLCLHFGHCEEFALFDVDAGESRITGVTRVPAPPHQPGLLPRWLAEQKANLIIAGGMGSRARSLFAECAIDVITGAAPLEPDELVRAWLQGTLESGDNLCDH